MRGVTFEELQSNLGAYFDAVEQDHIELIVTRQDHELCVIMALSEWEAMKETLHRRATPENAPSVLTPLEDDKA